MPAVELIFCCCLMEADQQRHADKKKETGTEYKEELFFYMGIWITREDFLYIKMNADLS